MAEPVFDHKIEELEHLAIFGFDGNLFVICTNFVNLYSLENGSALHLN